MTDPESDLFETIIRESPRVLPLVSDQGNREQLAEWLRSHETLMHASFEGNPLAVDFDVCILDEGAFEQYRDQLRQIKDEAEPVIVPYLLLLPEFDAGDVESDSLVDSVTASTVDEITTIPIKQRELEWRVQSLLRLRNQSIEAQTEGRRYQALFESVNDAILVTDTDRTIVDCNGSFTDLFGYSLAEIAGEPTHTIYEEDTEFEAMGDAIDEHIGDTSFRKVVSYETKTGAVFPGETGVFYLRDRNGTIQGYIRLIRDVSERLQREREFERYEAAIDGSTDLLMAADRDRLVMFTNKRFRELVGGDDQEVRGSHLRDILDEDVFETVDPRFERALDGETGQFDYEHPTDGEGARVFDVHYYPLREGSGDEITGVVAALRDVTEREQRKRKLRQFKQAVDAAGHAIYMTDADRQITYANQAFEDVTGYAPTDVIGRNPRLLKSGEMPDGYYAELWETVTSGETWEEEIINERGDGELYHAHQTIAPVTDETGTIEAYVAIQTDITDQKERIAAIERLSEYRYIQSEVNQLLITHNAEDDILSQIVEILADSGLYACTFLSTLDSESIEFICEAGSELDHAAVQLFHTAAYVDAVIDDGTLYIEDVTAPPFEQHLDDVPAHEGYAVELSYRDNSYGILTVHFPPGEEIRNEDRQLLEELAGDIGLFLHARQAEAEREMFGEIVQRLDDPVMFQDRSGAFQVINDAVAEYADQPRDALLEEDEFAFMDEEAARIVAEQKQRVLDTEQPRTYEVRETFPEKGERVFKTTRYPHYDTDGSVDGTVAICRDVTSLKEREKHLRVFDRVLRHNIYNNMNVVIGNAEWIHDTPQQNHEQAAQRILDTGNDLVALANNERRIVELLTDPHHAQPIVLSPILERVHDSITNEYPDSEVRIEGTLEVTVQAIPEIEKAIYELVENGIKHHSQGTPHVTVTVQEAADAILVRIKDNGPGIPEMERSVLLAEHDITPLLHGTGLGLWLVKHIVTQSGGQLAFRENDPVGSIIELRFQADE